MSTTTSTLQMHMTGAEPDQCEPRLSYSQIFPSFKNSGFMAFSDIGFQHFLEGLTPRTP